MNDLSNIHNQQLDSYQLLQLGPSLLHNMSKKIKNKFWQQVLSSAQKISEGAIFTFPEKIGHSSFWYNHLIKRNNRVIAPNNFPVISSSVSTLSDFFYPCTNKIMERNDFCEKFNINVTEEDFIEIRYIINLAFQKLKLSPNRVLHAVQPFKPLLIDIALGTKKGCSFYYKLIRKSKNMSVSLVTREQKWHLELDKTFSLIFWEKARKLCASINFENPLKWLQFQVLRNSLQTNKIVSHFIPTVSPECKFCLLSAEKISHLYWFCPIVSQFLSNSFAFISSSGLSFKPTREQFIFGYINEPFYTPANYLTLWLKKFIWKNKFKNEINLSVVGFKNYLSFVLSDLKKLYELKNNPAWFIE